MTVVSGGRNRIKTGLPMVVAEGLHGRIAPWSGLDLNKGCRLVRDSLITLLS